MRVSTIGLAAVLLLSAGVALSLAAGEAPLLTGAAAYGDWRSDAPGVRRKIAPADMPPPMATQPVAEPPRVVARPEGAWPKAPPGFSVSLFAQGLDMPRAIRVAPNGDVFVAESGAGRVRLFRPGPDGSAGEAHVFASGLSQPYGIAFWPPGPAPTHVYVAETGRVLRYPWKPAETRAAGPAEVVVP